jgi:hypothetical protein
MRAIVNAACEGGVTRLWRAANESERITRRARAVTELLRKAGSIWE